MRPNEASRASLAELQARLTRALFETHLPAPAGLLRARRFSVHRNNLYASLRALVKITESKGKNPAGGKNVGKESAFCG